MRDNINIIIQLLELKSTTWPYFFARYGICERKMNLLDYYIFILWRLSKPLVFTKLNCVNWARRKWTRKVWLMLITALLHKIWQGNDLSKILPDATGADNSHDLRSRYVVRRRHEHQSWINFVDVMQKLSRWQWLRCEHRGLDVVVRAKS